MVECHPAIRDSVAIAETIAHCSGKSGPSATSDVAASSPRKANSNKSERIVFDFALTHCVAPLRERGVTLFEYLEWTPLLASDSNLCLFSFANCRQTDQNIRQGHEENLPEYKKALSTFELLIKQPN